jgi:hypothetical protein
MRVQLYEPGNIRAQGTTDARMRAADFGSAGEAIGRGVEQIGSDLSQAAEVNDRIDAIRDEATVKQITNDLDEKFLASAYTSENAYFRQQGINALNARPIIEKQIDDGMKDAKKTLRNPRQQFLFDEVMAAKRKSWLTSIATHDARETLRYGVDQSQARAGIAKDAFVSTYDVDPDDAERQLSTALDEKAHEGELLGWSVEQVRAEQQKIRQEAYSSLAIRKALTSASDSWAFVEEHQDKLGPDETIRLQTQLRPRVMREQGVALANHLGGLEDVHEKRADGSTIDPLAPLPAGERPGSEIVWSRMVGPGGRGGIEGGTNPDGSFRTSPAGAIGPAQVMPGTAREAAQAAGLPYDEKRYKTDFAYNLAIGRAYYNKQLAKFGDPLLAAAAYNAGPGRVVSALKKGGAEGWTRHLPAETRNYVKVVSGGGSTTVASVKGTLGEQLRTLDAMDVPEEVKDSAREVLTRRAQTASMVAKQEHDEWLNGFMLSLHDGTAGKGDIAAARKSGRLSDYDEIARAEGIIEAREKENADLTNFNAALSDRAFTWNQYDDGQRKAVEAGVKAMGGGAAAAFKVWERTGILAKSGAVALRGSLVSTNAQTVREAANIAGNMLRRNPNAFAGVEGQGDIERAAVAFNHYVFDLGQAPEVAAARVAQENDPKFKEKVKFTDPQRQEAMKTLRQNGGVQARNVFTGAVFANAEAQGEANLTFHELITDNLARGMDLGTAQAQAAVQLKKVYGVNARGRIVKYPPEAIYPAIGGSHKYIYDDAERTVKQETGRTPVAVNLVPIPGVTDQDFRMGRPARYRLLYNHMVNGQKVVDTVPGMFAADTSGPAKELATQRRRSFAQERAHATRTQQAQRELKADPTMSGRGSFH